MSGRSSTSINSQLGDVISEIEEDEKIAIASSNKEVMPIPSNKNLCITPSLGPLQT